MIVLENVGTRVTTDSLTDGVSSTVGVSAINRNYSAHVEDGGAACLTALVAVSLEYKRAHGYVVVAVCVVGILANLANIVVLTRKKMRSAVNALLTALAAAELTLMCLYLPVGAYYYVLGGSRWPTLSFFRSDRPSLYYALCYSTLSVMCHAIAVWMTTAVATFRYVRLRFPLRGRAWCTMRSACVVIGVVVATAALLTAPNWVVNSIVPADNVTLTSFPYCVPLQPRPKDAPTGENEAATAAAAATTAADAVVVRGGGGGDDWPPSTGQGLYTIHESEFARANPLVTDVNYYLQAVFVRFLPTVSLATLTVLLVCIMRTAERRRRALLSSGGSGGSKATKALTAAEQGGGGGGGAAESRGDQQRQHNRTTRMLLAAVALVLSVELPHGILIILMLADASFRDTYDTLGDFIDMATLLSQSLNFFLYTAMSSQFRHTFFALFWRKWAERLEHDWSLLAAAAAATATTGARRSAAGGRGGGSVGVGGFPSRSLDGSLQPLSSMSACCRSLDDCGGGGGRHCRGRTAAAVPAAATVLSPVATGRAGSLSTDEFAECSALLLPSTSPRRCASGPPGLGGVGSRGSLINGFAKVDDADEPSP